MKQTLLVLAASLLVPVAAMGAGEPDAKHGRAKSAGFTAPVSTSFQVRLLPGQRELVFSMSGAPGERVHLGTVLTLCTLTPSPREERVGRGSGRGAFPPTALRTKAPPLPGPLLHPMEEREKNLRTVSRCTPGKLGPLKQLVGVMREQQLGSTILPEPCSVRKTNS